jgi:polyhydroxybutyrate depolymerase
LAWTGWTVLIVAAIGLVSGSALAAPDRTASAAAASMSFGGLDRAFRLYVPSTLDRSHPAPLLLVLHGGGGTGELMERLTLGGLNRMADREGVVVVYPNGLDRHWNDGRGVSQYRAHRDNVDDVGFLSALIDHLGRSVAIDRNRVFSTGISNGGLMSFRLARELSTKITAIAPVAISMSENIAQMRPPARPVPVVLIAGTEDPLVPWNGGDIGFKRGAKVGRVLSVRETVRYWAGHNQCAGAPAGTMESDRDPRDGTRVRREIYTPCREGADVVLYTVEGGGHTWPGGHQYLPPGIVGRTSRDIDANEVIWAFLKTRSMK